MRPEPQPVTDALAAVRSVEQQVATKGLESMGSLVAAARIRAWHESLGAIFALGEADIMECCLAIRQQHPGHDAFGTFVGHHLAGVLTPARAWQLADTWEVAKQHRPVRELVNREPKKALAFVREFTAAAAAEQVPLPLDADDRDIAGILASPPKKRRERLRELVAARRAPRDRNPDDVARIQDLEAEQAKRELEATSALMTRTRADIRQRYRSLAIDFSESASELLSDMKGDPLGKAAREHVEMSNDIAMAALQSVAGAIFPEGDDADD